ncbi:MAG: hypothetical protein ACLFVT_06325 [Syntrophobacteria bacterium]
MKKSKEEYVRCAHCGAMIRIEEAVRYQSPLAPEEHCHCKGCDPYGTWDCMSDDLDADLH